MRVDLGRRDIGVTKKILNHAKVGAADQEMSGEGVAKDVRVNIIKSRNGGVLPNELPNRDAFKRSAAET